VRTALVTLALAAAVLAIAGCTKRQPGADPAPAATSAKTACPSSKPHQARDSASVGGLDIRYLEHGKIKVLHVEDFPG
jgi:predicted small lipoprotein YifL